jgi:hypothetical protein
MRGKNMKKAMAGKKGGMVAGRFSGEKGLSESEAKSHAGRSRKKRGK